MRNILITGGAGFIGGELLKQLLNYPNIETIDIVDNFVNSKFNNILSHSKITFYNKSVQEFSQIDTPIIYDTIFHLASPVGISGILRYAGKMGPMIVNDVNAMAILAIKHNAHFITISTSDVYGQEENNIPIKEDIDKIVSSDITIRLEYGVAKLLAEISIINLQQTTNLSMNIIRPFNVVGIGQKSTVGFIVPRFIEAAIKNQPLTVFGDGQQKRTFTSVRDLAHGIILIAEKRKNGEIYNIGSPNNICSIEDIAKKVIKLSGSSSEIQYIDPKIIYGSLYKEAWIKIPNIDKLIADTGWQPSIGIDSIISEVVEDYKNGLQSSNSYNK